MFGLLSLPVRMNSVTETESPVIPMLWMGNLLITFKMTFCFKNQTLSNSQDWPEQFITHQDIFLFSFFFFFFRHWGMYFPTIPCNSRCLKS